MKRKKEKSESYWGLMDPLEKIVFIIAIVAVVCFVKYAYGI